MSDGGEVDVVLSLEDLFRSQEFGKPRAAMAHAEPTLFGRVPPRGPLVPLAATSSTGVIGHQTTTHERRNRTLFAAVSGVTAALLVAVGVATQNGTNNGSPNHGGLAVGGTHHHVSPPGPTGGGPQPTSPTTSQVGGGNTPAPVGLASLTTSTGNKVSTGTPTIIVICQTGCSVSPTKPPTTAPKPVSPTGTAPTGNVLTPVVVLVGHAVTTVGATVITASTGLTVTLPPLSPVTGLVGNVGGTLAGFGNMLSGTII